MFVTTTKTNERLHGFCILCKSITRNHDRKKVKCDTNIAGINFFMYFSWRNQINKIKNMTKTRLLIAQLRIFVRS